MSSSSPKDAYASHYDADKDFSVYYAGGSSFFNDTVTQPMRLLLQFFKSGSIKGDLLILYGGANNLALLLPAIGHFKEIIVADVLDGRLACFQNWVYKRPGAYDYSQTLKMICELEGDSGDETDKEEAARKSIKEVIKGELTDTHPLAPQYEAQADCVITSFSSEMLSSDLDSYRAALRSISSLIKVGGYLIMNVFLGCNFAMIGDSKLPVLPLTEQSVKEAVDDAGFDISESYVTPRTTNTLYGMTDFSSTMLLFANKVKTVD